jgi:hypothetical protein
MGSGRQIFRYYTGVYCVAYLTDVTNGRYATRRPLEQIHLRKEAVCSRFFQLIIEHNIHYIHCRLPTLQKGSLPSPEHYV